MPIRRRVKSRDRLRIRSTTVGKAIDLGWREFDGGLADVRRGQLHHGLVLNGRPTRSLGDQFALAVGMRHAERAPVIRCHAIGIPGGIGSDKAIRMERSRIDRVPMGIEGALVHNGLIGGDDRAAEGIQCDVGHLLARVVHHGIGIEDGKSRRRKRSGSTIQAVGNGLNHASGDLQSLILGEARPSRGQIQCGDGRDKGGEGELSHDGPLQLIG